MPDLIDPNQFVITRRRKKYKFAKFHNAVNCFEFDEWLPRPVNGVEIGAGTGMFSLELARRHPECLYAAVDVKADRLQQGAYRALEAGVNNLFFIRARADQVNLLFMPGSVDDIWLTFPDPFGRARSAGRRLSHPTYLTKYQVLLSPSGSLHLKHDNRDFFCWSLEQLVAHNWRIAELSFDLHQTPSGSDRQIMTTYEQRWLGEGLSINYMRATHI